MALAFGLCAQTRAHSPVCQAVSSEHQGNADKQVWRVRDSQWAHRAGSAGRRRERDPHTIKVNDGRDRLASDHRKARLSAVNPVLGDFASHSGSPSAADRPATSRPGVAARIGLPRPSSVMRKTSCVAKYWGRWLHTVHPICPLETYGA